MDGKRELSNFRRLQSIRAKKQGRNIQAEQIKASLRNLDLKTGVLNKKIVFHSDDSGDEDDHIRSETKIVSAKLSLFPSDNVDSDDDNIDQFQIRSGFLGPKGPQFVEESCDPRFQLNNLFMEEPSIEEEAVESGDEKNEKQKNMEILESVLGFQLLKNDIEPGGAKKKKKYVHFNPEDENSWKYLKKVESKADKTMGKEATTISEPQVSPVRYFEVSADLKSALQRADEEFHLSKMFEFSNGQYETNDGEFSKSDMSQKHDRLSLDDQNSIKDKKTTVRNSESLSLVSVKDNGNEQHQKFFIMPGDARLTEGIEFFRREKSMEEIYEDFFKTREFVLEILKKRHRRGLKSPYMVKNKR